MIEDNKNKTMFRFQLTNVISIIFITIWLEILLISESSRGISEISKFDFEYILMISLIVAIVTFLVSSVEVIKTRKLDPIFLSNLFLIIMPIYALVDIIFSIIKG